jgi:hypothetical protein
MKYSQFSSPFGTIDPPCSHDLLEIKFPLDEAIHEAMNMVSIPLEYLQDGFFFLPFWETF